MSPPEACRGSAVAGWTITGAALSATESPLGMRCTSGLSIGHCSPEAAEGGNIGLVEEGDTIEIDIPHRSIRVAVSDDELASRRAAMEAKGDGAWEPVNRDRYVSQALQAYAALTTSAARGAVRDLSQLKK